MSDRDVFYADTYYETMRWITQNPVPVSEPTTIVNGKLAHAEPEWTEEDEQLLQEHWAELMAEHKTPPFRIIEDPAMPRGSIGFIVI